MMMHSHIHIYIFGQGYGGMGEEELFGTHSTSMKSYQITILSNCNNLVVLYIVNMMVYGSSFYHTRTYLDVHYTFYRMATII